VVSRPDRDLQAGRIFAALADPTRRQVLTAVAERGSATATELSAVVPVSRQAVTKHLGVLAAAGLVASERHGRETRFEPRSGALRPAAAWIAETEAGWDARLQRLKRRIDGG
jgi:DNA-binding transcriptional ArsR family regulator